MPEKLRRRLALSPDTAAVSLVMAVACALASEAFANLTPTESNLHERDVPARVKAIVERIRLSDPSLALTVLPEAKITQWRNY
jgi:hypothetical protein